MFSEAEVHSWYWISTTNAIYLQLDPSQRPHFLRGKLVWDCKELEPLEAKLGETQLQVQMYIVYACTRHISQGLFVVVALLPQRCVCICIYAC